MKRFTRMFVSAIASFPGPRLKQLALGFADQGFSAGGMFLVNVVLARTQTKQDYGTFALVYSIFTFLGGLHHAVVLEPYTIYGAGRYQSRFPAYSRLMLRSNLVVGGTLSALLLLTCWLTRWISPGIPSRSLLGLGLTVSFILTGTFLRRGFYIERKPASAAAMSMVFFTAVAVLLWTAVVNRVLDNFSVFLVVALAWVAAGTLGLSRRSAGQPWNTFLETEPGYWREHWKYSRWVLATALVYQFMHQGYYWLVAGFLSVSDVADLKAMYLLIAPVEQVIISLSFLVLPALAARYAVGDRDGFLSIWKRYALGMSGLTLGFALAVRVAGARLMHILYAGKFDGLAPLLFVLALVPLLTGIGNTFGDAIRAAERPRLVFFAFVSSAIATFALGLPLVISLGLRGAVYGMLLSGATYAGALTLAFRIRLLRQPAHPPLPSLEQPL